MPASAAPRTGMAAAVCSSTHAVHMYQKQYIGIIIYIYAYTCIYIYM